MPPTFYTQSTVSIAKQLLGKFLTHATPQGTTVGKIVETEAYLSVDDLACHAASGQTKRNAVMFGPPGHAYIYFTYGVHWLINVVTAPTGIGEAVLLRSLEPVDGLDLMRLRRQATNQRHLCSGPAKLVQAMGITPAQNGVPLDRGALTIQPTYPNQSSRSNPSITTTTRVGIQKSVDLPLRFYLKDNSFVSKI